MAFNGEVYNHRELRRELETAGVRFRSESDTEVLLEAISRWGVTSTLRRGNGMFAFALWNTRTRSLTLARDRLGEKPLYYGWSYGSFLFGSELRAIRRHPSFAPTIDPNAIAAFLTFGCVPAPMSVFRGIRKIPAGTWIQITANGRRTNADPEAYWSFEQVARQGMASSFRGSLSDAIDSLDELMRDAVGIRLRADVPVGAFLSGGIDSSTIVAIAQQVSARNTRTFSIGFEEKGYNEAPQAREVAAFLGTDHVELYATPKQAMDVVPRLSAIYDEPFADASQVPTVLLSSLTRTHVKVGLSGDGGDELFGGYGRYTRTRRIWKAIGSVPRPLRKTLAHWLSLIPESGWDRLVQWMGPVTPSHVRFRSPGQRVHKLARLSESSDESSLYAAVLSHSHLHRGLLRRDGNAAGLYPVLRLPGGRESPLTLRMMAWDTLQYLPDDILVKVDRASMSVGLEVRVPLLDHRIVEFAWSLPLAMKVSGGRGKIPLRELLGRYVPERLVKKRAISEFPN